MNKKLGNNKYSNELRGLAVKSFLYAVLFFFLVVLLLFPVFTSRFCADDVACTWGVLEGFVGLFTLALIVGGLFFGAKEYSRQESQMSFQIYEAISQRLTNEEEEAARRWIYNNIPLLQDTETEEEWLKTVFALIHDQKNKGASGFSVGQEHLKRVLNALDYFGFISEHYMSVEEPFLEWMSAPVAKMWVRIGPYVEDEGLKRKERDYYRSAKYIGDKCVAYREKHNLKSAKHEGAT